MFKNLFNLSVARTKLEAFGFYIVYVMIALFLSGIISGALSDFFQNDFLSIMKFGALLASVYCIIVGVWIIWCKKLFSNIGAFFLLITGAFTTWLIGILFGFIFISLLTLLAAKQDEY